MLSFFKLVEQYRTQTEPAFCGLTSLAMVLNALSIDPRRIWKAPWRWFDETLLDCCKSLSLVQKEGLNLLQVMPCWSLYINSTLNLKVACLARCNGADVTMKYFGSFGLEEFRELVRECCERGEKHLIIGYSRKVLSQTGDGHFSPIGGYHAGKDMVLILDTARFKYPPHWVPLELLFKAMGEKDVEADKVRGFVLMKAPGKPISVCYSLNRKEDSWTMAEHYIRSEAPKIFEQMVSNGESLENVLRELVVKCPLDSVQKFMAVRVTGCTCTADAVPLHPVHSVQFLEEFQTLPLYQEVLKHLESLDASHHADEYQVGRVTALLLLRPPEQWPEIEHHPEVKQKLFEWMDLSAHSLVETEIDFLRHQMEILLKSGELEQGQENFTPNGDQLEVESV